MTFDEFNSQRRACVYALRAGYTDAVKIGKTVETLTGRMRGIQTGCPWPLVPIAAIECPNAYLAERLEGEIHGWIRGRAKSEVPGDGCGIVPLVGEWFQGVENVIGVFRAVTGADAGLHIFVGQDQRAAEPMGWRSVFRQAAHAESALPTCCIRPMVDRYGGEDPYTYRLNSDALDINDVRDRYLDMVIDARNGVLVNA